MSGHVVDRLSAYLDDELDGIERARVEKHLSTCPACAQHLEELLAVDEVTRRLELVEPPEGYFEALPGRLRERVRAEAPAPRRFVVPAWTWAAAAAVLVAVVAPLVLAPPSLRTPAATSPALEPRVTAPVEEEEPSSAARGEPMATAGRGAEQAAAAERRVAGPRDEILAGPRLAPTGAPLATRGGVPAAPKQGFATAEAERAKAAAQVGLAETQTQAAEGIAGGVPGGVVGGGVGGLPATPAPAREAAAHVPKEAGTVGAVSVAAESSVPAKASMADKGARAAAALQATTRELEKTRTDPAVSERAAFEALLGRAAETAEDARALREAWRSFATTYPASPRADEARVRVIETGLVAFRLGADPADRETALADANAYLARPDTAQAERVRRVLTAFVR